MNGLEDFSARAREQAAFMAQQSKDLQASLATMKFDDSGPRTADHTQSISESTASMVALNAEMLSTTQSALQVAQTHLERAEAALTLAEAARTDATLANGRAEQAERRAFHIGLWTMILTGAAVAASVGSVVVALVTTTG